MAAPPTLAALAAFAACLPSSPPSPSVPLEELPPPPGSTPIDCAVEVLDDPAASVAAVRPEAGRLFWAQLGLGGVALGEATLGQLPDGTRFAIDVGNDSHSDDLVDAIDDLFGERHLDVVFLTHHHADHEDGLEDLLAAVDVDLVVHRGFTDRTAAANDTTMARLCDARRDVAMLEVCESASGGCDAVASTAAAVACAGLDRVFGTSGDDASDEAGNEEDSTGTITIVGANGWTADRRYEIDHGPLLHDDSNGENARSLVLRLDHGPFRAVFAGDLTGGGSDTDPIEAFYVDALPDLGPVDVLHLSHHGRDTSSSARWLAAMVPDDDRPRVATAGISTAHVGSPHQSVIDAVAPRVVDGGLFVTRVAPGGSSDVVDADGGTIRVRTEAGGHRVVVQAVLPSGAVRRTVRLTSGRGCLP